MTQITYSTLTPGAPENVNDLNSRLSELKTVINGGLDSGNLAANSVGTSELIDGSVTTSKLASAVGAPLAVVSSQLVGDTGQASVIAPGRILGSSDFTGLGLTAPAGLYNLSSTADSSGNGRTLTNKGSVTFANGITGSASTAAQFTGSTAQAFYILDTGGADPFRIKTGSVGCWFKTAKRGTDQVLVSKWVNSAGNKTFQLDITSNTLDASISIDGTAVQSATSVTDVGDDRWHHGLFTFDGTTLRLYVDGVLEKTALLSGALFATASPFNIGGFGADAGTAATSPHFGRIDEAFVTADVLSDDQVRFLYCSKIAHAYPSTPKQSWVQVYRYKRGAALLTTDFPATPKRLHNFTAGALTDAGSDNQTLTNNNTAVAVAGPSGVQGDAFNFVAASSQSLSSTDTGLPSGTNSRSYGCWFKTSAATTAQGLIGWGTVAGNLAAWARITSAGVLITEPGITGPFVADGLWHHLVVVEENSPTDGLKAKLYLDGRLIGSATTINSITLAGANKFRIGSWPDATTFMQGQISRAFVTTSILTQEQVAVLYQKSSQSLSSSPKNEGDHIEGADSTYLYLDMSALPSNSLVDIQVQG